MINKQDIDAYMSIKAPDSLKEGILAEHVKNNSRISSKVRMCYSLAAALLVIVMAFAFLPSAKTDVFYGNTPINENAVLLQADNSNARITPVSLTNAVDIPLKVKTEKSVKAEVSHGALSLKDSDISAGQSLILATDTDIIWSVELADINDEYTITIGKVSYCISQNSDCQWVLLKK